MTPTGAFIVVDLSVDVATALAIGRRERQEDAVMADFVAGADAGFAVLSDGMGGHDDGDLASTLIVAEIFGSLALSGRRDTATNNDVAARLSEAVLKANQRLSAEVASGTGQGGMGGTVIASFIKDGVLRWISIGDSSLHLFRRGKLVRLNEVHSLAPQIDMMAAQGMMDPEIARTHPQRNYLTSALVGAAINRIDCPETAFDLAPGDILVMASDGLHVLDDRAIERIVSRRRFRSSQKIAQALMTAVASREEPDQDNVSIVVIKPRLQAPAQSIAGVRMARIAALRARIPELVKTARRIVRTPLNRRSAP